jgi:hypothetical protein
MLSNTNGVEPGEKTQAVECLKSAVAAISINR